MGELLIAILALAVAVGLFLLGLPNRRAGSPRFLRVHSAPMVYPAVVLVFLAIGIVELVVWAATIKWW
jgi:hypothetical protein